MSSHSATSLETLAGLNPFRDQDQATLQNIQKQAEAFSLSAGDVLFEIESIDFFTYYLLDGKLELQSKDQRTKHIESADEAAKSPIATLIPRQYTVRAVTDSTIVKFNTDTLNFTLYGDGHSGQVATDVEVDDDLSGTSEFEGKIFSEIYRGVANGNMHMPPLPSPVIRLLNLINTNEVSLYQLEMALQHDPDNVQIIIDIANSDLYTSEVAATDFKQAVSIISHRQVLFWLLALSMKSVFKGRTETMQVYTNNLWVLSSMVASIAAILARKTRLFTPAEAFLCGLMQDIGVLPIYRYLDKAELKEKNHRRIEKAVSDLRGEVSAMILSKWSFPENCNMVAREVENWTRDDNEQAEIADLILIAKLHAYLQINAHKPLPPMFKLPAFKKLGLRSHGPEAGVEMISEANQKINQLFRFLVDDSAAE